MLNAAFKWENVFCRTFFLSIQCWKITLNILPLLDLNRQVRSSTSVQLGLHNLFAHDVWLFSVFYGSLFAFASVSFFQYQVILITVVAWDCIFLLLAEMKLVSILLGVCNHAFHFHCISRWLKTRQVCPLGKLSGFQNYSLYSHHHNRMLIPIFALCLLSQITVSGSFRSMATKPRSLSHLNSWICLFSTQHAFKWKTWSIMFFFFAFIDANFRPRNMYWSIQSWICNRCNL